jgi:Helicase associated domain
MGKRKHCQKMSQDVEEQVVAPTANEEQVNAVLGEEHDEILLEDNNTTSDTKSNVVKVEEDYNGAVLDREGINFEITTNVTRIHQPDIYTTTKSESNSDKQKLNDNVTNSDTTDSAACMDPEGIVPLESVVQEKQRISQHQEHLEQQQASQPLAQQEQPLIQPKKRGRKKLEPYETAASIAKTFQPGIIIPSYVKPPPSNTKYSRKSSGTATNTAQQLPPIPCSAGSVVASQLDPDNPQHFDHFLFQLLMYKAENNTYNVQQDEYPELHTWMGNLKKMYKQYAAFADGPHAGSLKRGMTCTVAQIKVLESLHIPLTSRGNSHWNRFYDLLWQYKDQHGHVLVPRVCEIPGLGDWVTDQRRQYKLLKEGKVSQMNKERRDKLACLGFAFTVRHRPEWDQRYDELVTYKARFGHTKVPQNFKDSKALGKWVAKQREQYKNHIRGDHSFLTPYRLEKLNSINFLWRIRNGPGAGDGDSDNDDINSNNSNIPSKKIRTDGYAINGRDEMSDVKAAVALQEAAIAATDAALGIDDVDSSVAVAVSASASATTTTASLAIHDATISFEVVATATENATTGAEMIVENGNLHAVPVPSTNTTDTAMMHESILQVPI